MLRPGLGPGRDRIGLHKAEVITGHEPAESKEKATEMKAWLKEDLPSDGIGAFSSDYGDLAGRWRGDHWPACGLKYDIEVDFIDDEKMSISISENHQKGLSFNSQGSQYIVGIVEDIDFGGILFVRVSVDFLFMIEAPGSNYKIGDFLKIETPVNNVLVFPVGTPLSSDADGAKE